MLAVTNGRDVRLLPAAQDHKRLLEGDVGPNTGGMGAYSPVSIATPGLLARVEREVLLPTLAEMERIGAPFRGVLYAGLMISPTGVPNVIEFNCRLGDPETQVVLPLVESGLAELFWQAADGASLFRKSGLAGGRGDHGARGAGVSGRPREGRRDRRFRRIGGSANRRRPRTSSSMPAPGAMTQGVLRASGGRVLTVDRSAADLRRGAAGQPGARGGDPVRGKAVPPGHRVAGGASTQRLATRQLTRD